MSMGYVCKTHFTAKPRKEKNNLKFSIKTI